MFSEIQDTIMEKKINLVHVVVGVLILLFIANKKFTNEELVNILSILGYVIIIVHLFIILIYHFDKIKEISPSPVMEEYKASCNGGLCARNDYWNPLQLPCCDTCSKINYNYWTGKCMPK